MTPEDFDITYAPGGVACYQVSDGQVFVFEAKLLESLLEKARSNESGKVILFVKRGAEA